MLDRHLCLALFGIAIVLFSHLYMLYDPATSKKYITMEQHSHANIFAALLIGYYVAHVTGYTKY